MGTLDFTAMLRPAGEDEVVRVAVRLLQQPVAPADSALAAWAAP